MLYLLLAILKFIGLLLLWLLGIVFVLLLLILFVPIRYQFQGEYGHEIYGNFQCSWLCRFVLFRVTYVGKKLKYSFKIFGCTLYPRKKKRDKVQKKEKQQLETIGHIRTEDETIEESRCDIEEIQDISENIQNTIHRNIENEMQNGEKGLEEDNSEWKFFKIEESEDVEHPYLIKKVGLWIKKLYLRIKKITKTILLLGKNWKNKKDRIQKFIKNEKTRKAYKDCKYYTKKIILHTIPRKLEGELRFGFEDPAKTGELLSILSLAFPFYKDNIRIIPYFDQTRLEGKLNGKGRVSIGVCLYIFCRVWFHKEIRLTIKRAKKLLK